MPTKIIGLTGGIGSGKSQILSVFEQEGIPCFKSDEEAKKLMSDDELLRRKIQEVFGYEVYIDNILNRKLLASKVFKDKTLLNKLNSLVHPVVEDAFQKFIQNKNAKYVIKEAAILFETGNHKNCDKVILVCAPLELRIERIIGRDRSTREEVLAKIKSQWSDQRRAPLADYVINNIEWRETQAQINRIKRELDTLYAAY